MPRKGSSSSLSKSSNSSENENDFLETEFLKCKIEDIPIPNEQIEIYKDEVWEVMKCGCNRQIAEYVFIKYKELEDKEKDKTKLIDLKNNYNEIKKEIINYLKQKIDDHIYNKKKENIQYDDINNILSDYEDEIGEIVEMYRKNLKEGDNLIKEVKNCCEYYFLKILEKKEDKNIKKFLEERKKYIEKKEAVIESSLRNIKKIVNDKNEYKKFYKEYYGKNDEEE